MLYLHAQTRTLKKHKTLLGAFLSSNLRMSYCRTHRDNIHSELYLFFGLFKGKEYRKNCTKTKKGKKFEYVFCCLFMFNY